MSNSTPFAFYSGTGEPAGTQRIGNILSGTPDSGFSATELKWWNGPDEDLGYIIAIPDPAGNSIGADGQTAYLNFSRSSEKSEGSFVQLVNNLFDKTFTTGNEAKTWLNENGYWTSWSSLGPILLAHLNVNEPESYPNAGDLTWGDLIKGNNGALQVGSGTISANTYGGGTSLEFSAFDLSGGTGTRINLGNFEDTKLSTTTTKVYSIWFQADAVGFMSFSRILLCKMQGLGGSTTSDGFIVGINSSNQLVARVTSDNSATSKYISGIGATVSTGTWYMATLVVKVSPEENSFRLYLNNTLVGSTTGGGESLVSDNLDLLIGNYDSGIQSAMPFDGKVAEFRIYEGSFSDQDLLNLWNETSMKFGYTPNIN